MDVRSKFLFPSLCFLTLILAGCGGSSNSGSTTPPPTTYVLTVTAPAANTGTITSNPGAISCPGTCTASFNQNTQVTLTAAPAANYTFGGWGGACSGTSLTCQITITAATTVTATFTASTVPTFAVTVTIGGTGTGTVTSAAVGISCASGATTGCTANVAQNTQVTLTEAPGTTSAFTGWSGAGCTGTGTTCTFTVTAATAITANFGPSTNTPYAALNHIILFADENRSLDHYFGYMRQYWANIGHADQSFDGLPQFNPAQAPGVQPPYLGAAPSIPGCNLANDVASCSPDPTNPITSFSFHDLLLPSGKTGTVCEENQSPFWNEAHNDWDYTNPADQPAEAAKLNGFVFTAAYDARSNSLMDVNGVRGIGYYQDADLNFYYALATAFGTSDRFFSPVMDRTQLNRAYIYAATSQGYAYPPGGGNNDNAPFSAMTIFQALETANISWKIYIDPTNVTYNGTNCETAAAGEAQDLCLAGSSYMNMFVYEAQIQDTAANPTLWQHFAPISQFLIDIQDDATFPQFAYIEPASSAGLDEHPSDSDYSPVNVQLGAQYVQQNIIGPFLTSAIWNDSALIFTYDEAGGLYDHVSPQPVPPPGDENNPIDLVGPPPTGGAGDICTNPGQVLGLGTCTFGWTGYRIPLVVLSPYAKPNFVSHTVRDTTAVLAMVEARFLNSTPLTNRDAYYLPGNTTDYSMDEFFDFSQQSFPTPPALPTQDTSEICDQTPAASWNEPPLVTAKVTGGGSVSSNPPFLVNNNSCVTNSWCTVPAAAGSTVTLTATPNSGSTFTGWSGGGCSGTTPTCSVTAAGQLFVTATFNP